MKRLCLLIFLFLSCEQEEPVDACADTTVLNDLPCQTFINVTPPCIIQEVLASINGNQLEKYVYFHDGSNYSKIEYYYRSKQQDNYPELPAETISLMYEGPNIKEVVIQPSASPGTSRKYYFDYKELEVTILFELIVDGETTFTNSYDQLFVTEPNDSIYLSEGSPDILREYKNGNNTRFAVEDENGRCVVNNQRWQYTSKMSHDSNPNIFKDYAVRFPLFGAEGYSIQFWFGNNKNNMVASTNLIDDDDKDLYCYIFLHNGDQLWIKKYILTADVPYEYSYNYSCE